MTDQDPTQPFDVPPPAPPTPAAELPAAPTAEAAPVAAVQPEPAPVTAPVDVPAAAASPGMAGGAGGMPAAPPPATYGDQMMSAPPAPPVSYESPVTPVAPVAPVADGPRPRRRNPLRWVVALVVIALIVAGGVGATMLLTSSSGSSAVAAYVPADTLVYGEMRLDFPGSQKAEVANTLAAFPGFADQAALGTKMGELLDRVVKAATNDKHDYQTEIAPWFGGQLGIAEGPTPTLSASNPDVAGQVRLLLLANATDTAKATTWINGVLAEANAKTTTVPYNGTDIQQVQEPAGSGVPQVQAGYAFIGKVLVLGDMTSVKAAIDTKGTSGLSSVPNFQKAVAALPGDHVAFTYENLRALVASSVASITAMDSSGAAAAALTALEGVVPEWTAMSVRAANGNLEADSAQPAGGLGPTTNRTSDIAALSPPNTIALVDMHDVGKSLTTVRDKFAADPKLDQYVKQLDSILGLAGGFQGAAGWIGDMGVAVTSSGSSVSGGVIIRPDDAAAAGRLFTQLRALLGLGGGSAGISITDEQYNGATITTVDLSMLAPLLDQSMSSSGVSVPSNIKLSYATTDKVVVLSLDPAFVKAVLDTSTGGASLAKDPRFSALLAEAYPKNTGLYWLDITAARGLVEGMMPADARAKYEADVRPYLLPLDALISTGAIDGDLARGTMILSIKH